MPSSVAWPSSHCISRACQIAARGRYVKRSSMPPRAIRFHNTMTQRLEPLQPLEPGHIGVDVCGLTTYDHAHAGHARTFTVFDVLVRFLRATGLRVTFVRNVTDVEDKSPQARHRAGRVAARLVRSAWRGSTPRRSFRAIGCMDPDLEPRVSESIPDIVAIVESLVATGAAYVAPTPKGNDVYFGVRAFPAYGKLSHRNIDDLLSGARIEPGEAKRDPLDFALWKSSAPDEWGWESPWGRGRPGWHIECSAMAAKSAHSALRRPLVAAWISSYPHHENEIAQSEAAWGEPFARTWLHAGFLNVDSEKMSKSLGNFVTIAQILERNDWQKPCGILLLGAHYRGPRRLRRLEARGRPRRLPGARRGRAPRRIPLPDAGCAHRRRSAGRLPPSPGSARMRGPSARHPNASSPRLR